MEASFNADTTQAPREPDQAKLPIRTITAPASGTPYTSQRREFIFVYGGTGLSTQFSRLGASITLPGGLAVLLTMPGDSITCNYLTAPSLTIIPQ